MKLFVSFQFGPLEKMPVGMLSDFGRDTVFEYDPSFLARGITPAPFRLPLRPGVQVYDRMGNMETFGLFEDSFAGVGENPTKSDLDRLAKEVGL